MPSAIQSADQTPAAVGDNHPTSAKGCRNCQSCPERLPANEGPSSLRAEGIAMEPLQGASAMAETSSSSLERSNTPKATEVASGTQTPLLVCTDEPEAGSGSQPAPIGELRDGGDLGSTPTPAVDPIDLASYDLVSYWTGGAMKAADLVQSVAARPKDDQVILTAIFDTLYFYVFRIAAATVPMLNRISARKSKAEKLRLSVRKFTLGDLRRITTVQDANCLAVCLYRTILENADFLFVFYAQFRPRKHVPRSSYGPSLVLA